jgi:hypothetical protein
MMWQEWVIMACQLGFVPATWPMIAGPHKPAREVALRTSALLWMLCATFLTIPAFFAAAGVAIPAAMWTILSVQTWRKK